MVDIFIIWFSSKMRSWDDIDDLTDIYINQVVYPEEEEDYEDDGYSNTERREIIEMPRSIFITQVCRSINVFYISALY